MNNTNEQIKEQPWNYKYQLNRTDWTHEWNKTIYESLHLKQQCSASHTIDPFRCDCTWEFSIAGRYLFAFILSPPNAIRMVIHVAHTTVMSYMNAVRFTLQNDHLNLSSSSSSSWSPSASSSSLSIITIRLAQRTVQESVNFGGFHWLQVWQSGRTSEPLYIQTQFQQRQWQQWYGYT